MTQLISPDDPIFKLPKDLESIITKEINKVIIYDYDGISVCIYIDDLIVNIKIQTLKKYSTNRLDKCIRRYASDYIDNWNAHVYIEYIRLIRKL